MGMRINMIDSRVEKLAGVGHADPSYQMMMYHIEQQTDSKHLELYPELKKL